VSRIQLALNVSDVDASVDFYSKLFGAEPAKRRPGYANFAISDPPLKLVLIEDTLPDSRDDQPPWDRGGEHRRGDSGAESFGCERPGHDTRGEDLVLLRPSGQGVGERAWR